ncbi:hypothetical protein RFI_37801, partial [Reticulomyxa filosa]
AFSFLNISVFNLNTFQFIKHDILPIDIFINHHCFISKSENEEKYQMLLFCFSSGLSIKYDENNNTFRFHPLPICKDITLFKHYAYVCVNNVIFFFGGWNDRYTDVVISKSVYKYSIRENKWTTF